MCCRSISADTFYVAYSTAHQVVGVMAWPLDGDPNKSLALIAHPGNVAGMNLSHDGCKLVTAGADDGSIMIWQVLSPSQTLAHHHCNLYCHCSLYLVCYCSPVHQQLAL